MASATENVATVTMLLIELGKTWRRMMCHLRAPMAVAAWEYSRFLIRSASPRMMRALPHHPVKPMMTDEKDRRAVEDRDECDEQEEVGDRQEGVEHAHHDACRSRRRANPAIIP